MSHLIHLLTEERVRSHPLLARMVGAGFTAEQAVPALADALVASERQLASCVERNLTPPTLILDTDQSVSALNTIYQAQLRDRDVKYAELLDKYEQLKTQQRSQE